MFNSEYYKNNIDVEDSYGIKVINVDKSVTCRGSLSSLSKVKENEKIKPVLPLAAAIIGVNNTATPLPSNLDYHTSWTDIDTQETILSSKPTCYIVIGKPGSGTYSLGKALAKELKCVHICPTTILTDEIDQQSSTGLCLDFNMRHNNAIKFYTLLAIMKNKIKSPTIKHRGYIISGFPLVTSNRNLHYLYTSMHGEESILVVKELLNNMIYNLKKKSKKEKEHTLTPQSSVTSNFQIEEEEEEKQEESNSKNNVLEEKEPPVELPKFILDSCSNIIFNRKPYFDSKKATLITQFKEVISLDMPADIIISLSCPDMDLITKKKHKFVNYGTSVNLVDPFFINIESELRWPVKYNMNDFIRPYEEHTINSKYNCRQPINFKEASMEQICNYQINISSYVNQKLKDTDPKYLIKLDSRISVNEMVYQTMERLIFLPLRPVLIPEPLLLEESYEDIEEFWKSVQNLNVIQSGVVKFIRYTSPWFNRCPVELKNRQSVCGNTKYAVAFFRHIYLLSSLSNMTSFCINPRPFLKLKYLEPTCRIIVLGTKSSGKTFVAECLSWIFDTAVINYDGFVESEKQKKYDMFAKTILSEIIATIEDARLEKWHQIEMERYLNLEMWYSSTVTMIKAYIPLLIEYIRYQRRANVLDEQKIQGTESHLEIFPDIQQYDSDTDIFSSYSNYTKQLSFLPFLYNVEECERAIIDKTFLVQYAPETLKTINQKPCVPALEDEDVSQAISAYIVANGLQKEIEPTVEEIMNEMVKVLYNLDSKCKVITNSEHLYCTFIIDGFPSDPECWGYLSDSKLLPDFTIALIENRELDYELIKYYSYAEKIIKNHPKQFLLSSDPLIKIKLQGLNIAESRKMDIDIILNDVVNIILNQLNVQNEVDENDHAQFSTTFSQSIEKLREDWDSVKQKLDEHHKCYIEVQLENKTDIQIMDEVLLGVRKCYNPPCETNEDVQTDMEDEERKERALKDFLVYNNHEFLSETNIYCPITYFDHGILWEGKPEFCLKYNDKVHYFSKEECLSLFKKDPTKYQSYNHPYKSLPSLKICVIGPIGSGKTSLSKYIAKELGLLHINITDFINAYLRPKHFKKVGRQYENYFTDSSLDDEAVIEFQMAEDKENLTSDILFNDNEIKRMINNYFERGVPMSPILIQNVIKKIWFERPFCTTGIVLDGFPRLPDDVEHMVSCFCIPDLVIELDSSIESSLQRMTPLMLEHWKAQLFEAKDKANMKLNNERIEWMTFITKNIIVKLINDEILDKVFFSVGESFDEPSTDSLIIDANPSGSSNIDANLFNTYNLMLQEFPEPVDKNEWDKPEQIRERIEARIESIFEYEEENIQTVKDLLIETKIRVVTINTAKPFNKVLKFALLALDKIRNRSQSLLEETYIIDLDIAEVLLTRGFYFLSKFNRLCPVFIFENPNITFNPHKLYKRNNTLYSLIHRSYIYFIFGEDNVRKFRLDPLKYVDGNAVKTYFEYPLRISVIGAPKSGKSELAQMLARKYGLLCISRGLALRKTLESLSWTDLSSKITKNLNAGVCIDPYLVMKCVQIMVSDHRASTYGYIFDGFPVTTLEAMELKQLGLYSNIVFDVTSNKDNVLDRSQKEVHYDIVKIKPPYSKPLIQYRYTKWTEKSQTVLNWINEDYQNCYLINGNNSRWQCLKDADHIIDDIMQKVNYYLKNVKLTIVPTDGLCITNEIFERRMSEYKNVCPLCLRCSILRQSGYPVNRKGIVQYRNNFYWICKDHINMVLKHPNYLLATKKVEIPEIPAIVKTIDLKSVYENGICIVTYSENLPDQKIVMGTCKLAVNYLGKTYLFCSSNCLNKFMEKPHMYNDIVVFKISKLFPALSVNKLPHLGYLEQTIGTILTDACCSVNVIRPKYPGITIQLSGLIYIALYLKTRNPQTDKRTMVMYDKSLKTFEDICKLILDIGLRLRSMDNPLAKYPACCQRLDTFQIETVQKSKKSIRSITRMSDTISDDISDFNI